MRFEQIQILITCLVFFIAFFLNFPKIKGEEKNEPHLKHRVYFFDFIRTISIIAVIYIHIIGFFDGGHEQNANRALIYLVKVVRFCVPFFIISSGYTLSIKSLSKKDILDFYKKRFLKLYVPYIIFFTINFFLTNTFIITPYYNNNPIITLFFGTDGGALTIFYFIHILSCLYLSYPLFILLFNKIKNTKLFLFVLLIFSLIASFYFPTLFNNFVYTFFPYLFYFALGIFIRKYEDNKKVSTFIKNLTPYCIITIVLFLILLFFEERDTIYSNFNIAYTTALFILLYNIKDKLKSENIFFETIGRNSLFIFIFHFFCLQLLFKHLPGKFENKNALFLLVTTILELIISLGILPFISIGVEELFQKIKHKLTK